MFVSVGPVIKSVGPDKQMTASLFSEASFDCEAEASPTPSYQWLQRVQGMETSVLVRSNDARLHIRNVSYHHQGEYICRVWNYIGGSERSVQSDPVVLQVVGEQTQRILTTTRMLKSITWMRIWAQKTIFRNFTEGWFFCLSHTIILKFEAEKNSISPQWELPILVGNLMRNTTNLQNYIILLHGRKLLEGVCWRFDNWLCSSIVGWKIAGQPYGLYA